MTQLLAQIFISWPTILGSLLISICGIISFRLSFLVVGSLLSIGFAWYLTGLPFFIFKLLGFTLPLLHIVAIYFVSHKLRWAAGLLLTPHLIIAVYFGLGVLKQGLHAIELLLAQ
ncbi:hypothetical protein [Desulforamulus aquiferis]|uniref:Uncharacterized protein n=1 Tax=Desulforamulus aquiferis TaxID=1397668 RepID=A0AAW7ZBL5_9FIRM|nr:hypothetical protein [Desulforamulus aquiferis]MDO7786777.1 hypothetical protein [Desulforamulus aquiferis]